MTERLSDERLGELGQLADEAISQLHVCKHDLRALLDEVEAARKALRAAEPVMRDVASVAKRRWLAAERAAGRIA